MFRIAKNAEAAEGFWREARLLPALAPAVPIRIPEPQWYRKSTDAFPFGIIGYRKVPGVALTPWRLSHHSDPVGLARQIAAFMHSVHAFPAGEASTLGAGGPLTRSGMEAVREETLPVLGRALTDVELERVLNWWDEILSDPVLEGYDPVLCHGDLWYEHILVDQQTGELTGVLDFECAHVGDLAHGDFAPLRHLGHSFTGRVLREYFAPDPPPPEMVRRIQRYWEFREFWGVQYALRYDDPVELNESIGKLRRGAILSLEAHPALA